MIRWAAATVTGYSGTSCVHLTAHGTCVDASLSCRSYSRSARSSRYTTPPVTTSSAAITNQSAPRFIPAHLAGKYRPLGETHTGAGSFDINDAHQRVQLDRIEMGRRRYDHGVDVSVTHLVDKRTHGRSRPATGDSRVGVPACGFWRSPTPTMR